MVDVPVPKPRWYHLTPDRVVLGLLAVEGFLLFSEWFEWFAINRHKGYTVVIAVAVVAAAILLMMFWFLAALLFRLRFQFSIRTLLALPLVVAVLCGWLATEMKQARKQREAAEELRKAGGDVLYSYQLDPSGTQTPSAIPPEPSWLRALLGDDFFANVPCAAFDELSGDAGLEHLRPFTHLQVLYLNNTKVTDAGLENLKGLRQLEGLNLQLTKIGDAGLEHIMGLRGSKDCTSPARTSATLDWYTSKD